VLALLRELAREVGGERAARAVTSTASLERDVGLGSLERVELLLRLENVFGGPLGESFLALDTARELAQALAERPAVSGRATSSMPEIGRPDPLVDGPPDVATLPAVLLHRAQTAPQRVHVWLPDEQEPGQRAITYGRLLAEARQVAGGLEAQGIARGDTVALMLPTGLDFLASFLGVQIVGAIPVPIYPPVRLNLLEEYAARQSRILRSAGVRLLIAFPRALPMASVLAGTVPSLRAVVTVADLKAPQLVAGVSQADGTDTALIQYTSGSTGDPKGVQLTHAQLLANVRAIGTGVNLGGSDVVVSWLPLYHDMGLIGAWLSCLYHGVPLVLLSPLAFLSRPERWLTLIHEYRATISAAPNFAYELCARKVSDAVIDGLDLSSWRCALSGAEPISPETLERFAQRFARAGFRREALLPVYGLAENSVALCFPPLGRGPRIDAVRRAAFQEHGRAEAAEAGETGALRFVSVGRALAAHEIGLLDEDGAAVPERTVGRLVFRGPSAMVGYFGRPEATAAVTLPGGWIDSGDLAYRADGEIFIAGRLKDLIIKGGRNLVPQEIEEAASSVDGVRKGCVVAFGVVSEVLGTERLVIVAETRLGRAAERDTLAAAITERVVEVVGIPPDSVELVPPHSVAKTSSGKVRRAATRELYISGRLGRSSTALGARLKLTLGAAAHALRPLRTLARVPYAAYVALVVVAMALALWLPVLLLPGRRAVSALARWASRALLRLVGCRLACEGRAHLAALRGPLVLACNHASYVDVLALLALLPSDVAFVAKREVFGWPLVGAFARKGGHAPVERSDARQSVADAERIGQALRSGERLLFFPEGTFSSAVGLRPFRLGAFKAAVEAHCPVVPLALSGTRRVLRGDAWLPHPGPIHLWIGAPLDPPKETDFRALVDLRERVAEVIAAHCGEPRLALMSAALPRPTTG
jgi:fatty-acyl-CoA synthase